MELGNFNVICKLCSNVLESGTFEYMKSFLFVGHIPHLVPCLNEISLPLPFHPRFPNAVMWWAHSCCLCYLFPTTLIIREKNNKMILFTQHRPQLA